MSATRTYRDLLGADRPDSVSGETFDDHDPYTGEVVARVPAGGREDARRAIETASEAFASWSKSPPALRQQIFLKAADILESRQDEVVSLRGPQRCEPVKSAAWSSAAAMPRKGIKQVGQYARRVCMPGYSTFATLRNSSPGRRKPK